MTGAPMRQAVRGCPGGDVSGKCGAEGTGPNFQVLDRLPGFGNDHVRHQMAMAVPMVAFEAQQTTPPPGRQTFRFGQRPLGFRRFHMGIEDRHHALGVARPYRIAAWFGCAEALQMDVTDPNLVETRGELTFREARFAGRGHCPNIDQQAHTRFRQRGQHAVDGAALISDCREFRQHGDQLCANQSSIRRRAMLSTRGN